MSVVLRRQVIYKRGSAKICKTLSPPNPGKLKTRLLILLVALVGLLLLSSSLAFSRTMQDMQQQRLPASRSELEKRYFRQMLEGGDLQPEIYWREYAGL